MGSMKSAATALALGIALLSTVVILTGGAAAQKKPPTRAVKAGKPRPHVAPANIAAGTAVYQKSGCAACHAISGKGGKSGPDLTHVGKTRTAAYLTAYIRNPKSKKSSSKMPAYAESKIGAKDMQALTAYVSSLK